MAKAGVFREYPNVRVERLFLRHAEMTEVLQWAEELISEGAKRFPERSYEEGVRNTLRWVLKLAPERPDE